MTKASLELLIDQAITLDREIAAKTEALKGLKAKLVLEAKSRMDEHEKTEGGGSSWTTTGSLGHIARVTFPGKKLKAAIQGEGEDFDKITRAAGGSFHALFKSALIYVPVKGFREKATEIMGQKANALIKLCQGKSSTTVSFETKEAA